MGDAARIIICNAVIDEILDKKLVEKTVRLTLFFYRIHMSNNTSQGSSWRESLRQSSYLGIQISRPDAKSPRQEQGHIYCL